MNDGRPGVRTFFGNFKSLFSLSIQVCPKISGLTRTNPVVGMGLAPSNLRKFGKGMDPEGFDTKKYQNISKLYTVYRKPRFFLIPRYSKKIKQPTGNWGGPGRSS